MDYKIYLSLFLFYSICGWVMEVIVVYFGSKKVVNRGFLFGPYCSIYGLGSIIIIALLNDFNSIGLLFILSFIICGLTEYFISFLMEKLFNARWWDYSNRILNINGRFCLKNGIYFGLLGVLIIKFINPIICNFLFYLSDSYINIFIVLITIIFLLDNILSMHFAFKLKKIIKFNKEDNTNQYVALRKHYIFKK